MAKPRLSLARLSVVWGEGPLKGQILIDDYIRGVETVLDFLTPYSGINKGDLDPLTSQRDLVSMKSTYMKLRNIADQGVVFVGHGLKQDFKIISIVVPERQSIDTVNLYWIRGKRKLSLRVLSKFFLGQDIQQETHDSTEDARAALELFHCYKYLCQNGTFHAKLRELYRLGNSHGWDYLLFQNYCEVRYQSLGKYILSALGYFVEICLKRATLKLMTHNRIKTIIGNMGMDQGIALMTQHATYLSKQETERKEDADQGQYLYLDQSSEKN